MSFHELSRRELQSRCKEYGLPANKSNAATATSLTTFLGDPRTNVLVRAPQVIWPKKCVKARVLQPINTETSLASFILEASGSRARVVKPSEGRKLSDLCAFVPVERIVPQPKNSPLLRRKKSAVDAAHRPLGPVESEPVASPSEAVLHGQGCQKKSNRCCEGAVQLALRPLVFRITAKVDKLITKASTILRTFEEWKVNDTLPTALETH